MIDKSEKWQSALAELNEFKCELKRVLGKDKDFTVGDVEKYIKILYGVGFYNSLEVFYEKVRNKIIKGHDMNDYVDCLGYNVLKQNYKVTEITDPTDPNRKALVFFAYDGNLITDTYLEGDLIGHLMYYQIFMIDGEKHIKYNFEQSYSMSDEEEDRLIKLLI